MEKSVRVEPAPLGAGSLDYVTLLPTMIDGNRHRLSSLRCSRVTPALQFHPLRDPWLLARGNSGQVDDSARVPPDTDPGETW